MLLALVAAGCQSSPPQEASLALPPRLKGRADLRITEEPYESQTAISRRMQVVTAYLKKATGLTVEYVPAINYAHSHELLKRGLVDLITVGAFGGYQLMQAAPEAQPLVVQKPSFRLVMLANKRRTPELAQLEKQHALVLLAGRRIGFGSRDSGASYLQPLLAMQKHGVSLKSIAICWHEPVQTNLPVQVADGTLDFAFIASFNGDPLQNVASELRKDVVVAWMSEPHRNDYIITRLGALDPEQRLKLERVREALLALDTFTPGEKEVLASWGYTGFEYPSPAFPGAMNQRIKRLLAQPNGLPTCESW